MPAIGYVKHDASRKSFEGALQTIGLNAPISVIPNRAKKDGSKQPDYVVMSGRAEVGAGWIKTGKTSGQSYVSLSIATPAFGRRAIYANLGAASGQDDPSVYAIIWNADTE
jgi:uncharacterized protein (DUF736 family)